MVPVKNVINNMKKYFSSIILGLLILSGCQSQTISLDSNKYLVVTTIPPLYSLTNNLIANTDIQLVNLIPNQTSVHNYSLRPQDAELIAKSNLIIINGVELEHFMESSLEQYTDKVVDTSLNVSLIENSNDEHDTNKDEHEHGEYNPHIWMSPINAIRQAENIRNSLVKMAPEYKTVINKNRKELIDRLNTLDNTIETSLDDKEIAPYIVFHSAYKYLEKRYDLEASATLSEFPNDSLSATEMANIVNMIKEKNIKFIFTEPQFNSKTINTLTEDYDLEILTLDPLGQTTKDGYFEMMRFNLKNLIKLIK